MVQNSHIIYGTLYDVQLVVETVSCGKRFQVLQTMIKVGPQNPQQETQAGAFRTL